jgi:uncharacterized DUF497 family protein
MEFEWDEEKHHRNCRERGFGFDFAASSSTAPSSKRGIFERIMANRAFSPLARLRESSSP